VLSIRRPSCALALLPAPRVCAGGLRTIRQIRLVTPYLAKRIWEPALHPIQNGNRRAGPDEGECDRYDVPAAHRLCRLAHAASCEASGR
jgi:hypothetical protein